MTATAEAMADVREYMGSSKVERYLTRVDAHLADKSPDERRTFLHGQIEQWQQRYENFQARIDRCQPVPPGIDCFDYINTLAGLDQRLTRAGA